jgi:hypothetical protein
MNFKTDEEIKKLRSFEYYKEKIKNIHPSWKESIIKKFKVITSMSSGIDSQPVDGYRLIGQQIIRIELIEELNQIIIEQTGRGYQFIRVWVRELYELWKLSHEMLGNGRQLVRTLNARGIYSGFYDPKSEEKEKSNEQEVVSNRN